MKTVWKYDLYPAEYTDLLVPSGAQVLTAQTQGGKPQLWALVDPDAALEPRRFVVLGTGHTYSKPLGQYIGTFQLDGGVLVFHVFEVPV